MLEPVNVTYYDGVTSKQHKVTASIFAPMLFLSGKDIGKVEFPLSDLEIAPRVGKNSLRVISMPNGASIEFSSDALVDAVLAERPRKAGFHALAYRMESKLRYVGVGVLILVFSVWGFFTIGVPYMAKQIAYNLPTTTDSYIGKDLLKTLDRLGQFSPTAIPIATQTRLRNKFSLMVKRTEDSHDFQLKFRKMGSPNALALPSGIIVLTDKFVKLAKTDEEIIAVLAHEIGHVVNRHSIRTIIQTSAIGVILTLFVGDSSSMSTLAANLPTFLLFSKYSRSFESEADDYALRYLQKNNINPMAFVTIMERLSGINKKGKNKNLRKNKYSDFTSSHPATYKRIEKFRKAAQLTK